jgi:hydrogenase maturation factor
MCLGEYATVVEVIDPARAVVSCRPAGTYRDVSLAVLAAEGTPVVPGDVVMVSIGIALRVVGEAELARAAAQEVVS